MGQMTNEIGNQRKLRRQKADQLGKSLRGMRGFRVPVRSGGKVISSEEIRARARKERPGLPFLQVSFTELSQSLM